jgi:hypothetical protein
MTPVDLEVEELEVALDVVYGFEPEPDPDPDPEPELPEPVPEPEDPEPEEPSAVPAEAPGEAAACVPDVAAPPEPALVVPEETDEALNVTVETGLTSVVTDPNGQFVTVGAHEEMV